MWLQLAAENSALKERLTRQDEVLEALRRESAARRERQVRSESQSAAVRGHELYLLGKGVRESSD